MRVSALLCPFCLFCCTVAFGHPMSPEECMYFANDAALDVQDRDKGVTLKEQIEEAAVGIPKCKEKLPRCIYQDEQDTDRVMQLLAWVYSPAAKDMTPLQVFNLMQDACTRAAHSGMPPGVHPSGPQIQG